MHLNVACKVTSEDENRTSSRKVLTASFGKECCVQRALGKLDIIQIREEVLRVCALMCNDDSVCRRVLGNEEIRDLSIVTAGCQDLNARQRVTRSTARPVHDRTGGTVSSAAEQGGCLELVGDIGLRERCRGTSRFRRTGANAGDWTGTCRCERGGKDDGSSNKGVNAHLQKLSNNEREVCTMNVQSKDGKQGRPA